MDLSQGCFEMYHNAVLCDGFMLGVFDILQCRHANVDGIDVRKHCHNIDNIADDCSFSSKQSNNIKRNPSPT